MKNKKYVCFDIGNVLCNVNLDVMIDAISEETNVSKADGLKFLTKIQKMQDLGIKTVREGLEDYFPQIKSEVILNNLVKSWNMTLSKHQGMFNLINNLDRAGVKIALLSNIGSEHAEHLRESLFKDNAGFQNAIQYFSYEVGARKPSSLYYQSFLLKHPEFQGCYYVDDLEANLDIGQNFAFKTILFDVSGKYFGKTCLTLEDLEFDDI